MKEYKNRGIQMDRNNTEKSLIKVNKINILFKIKNLFNKIFKQKRYKDNIVEKNDYNLKENIKKEQFREYIKNIENEETRLIKLQKKYRNGEIKENQLTKIEIKSLCDLYDKQIEKLQKSNEFRKQRILQYRKKLQSE